MKDTLINNFLRISNIPRGSGNEKQISDYFVNIAKINNLDYYQDENNNVLIKKKGNIIGDSIAFQAHFDMVCAKDNNSNHDFLKDGIEVIINGNEVTAKGTSLGADQGVGLAIMLTLIESNDLKHPDLEFLFTVEEETTFKGAVTFPYDKVVSRKMINLDNSHDDSIVIASAGDIVNEYIYEGKYSKKDLDSYKLTIDNIPGGNSGDNIEKSENNAIITLVKELLNKDVYLKSIHGGTFENDIATKCEIIIQTDIDIINNIKNSNIIIEKIDNNESMSLEDTNNILGEIINLKSGYITNTASANLGMIKTEDNKVYITYMLRSIDNIELNNIANNINNLNYNFNIKNLYTDSIWKINNNSILFEKYKDVYYNLFKEKPNEIIVQGGLEIAAIQKRIEGIDIISIGANMEGIHTTDEVTYISSWEKIYNIIVELIKR